MRGVVLSRANVILSECEGSLFTGDSSAFSLRMAKNIFSVDITPHPGLPQSGEGVYALRCHNMGYESRLAKSMNIVYTKGKRRI